MKMKKIVAFTAFALLVMAAFAGNSKAAVLKPRIPPFGPTAPPPGTPPDPIQTPV